MKLFITFLCSLVAFNMYAQQEELDQLLSIQNINVSEVLDICSPDICLHEICTTKGFSSLLLTEEKKDLLESFEKNVSQHFNVKVSTSKKAQKLETNLVAINIVNGFTFHVADYYGPLGNSRVITCLDGDMRGYQTIADNGIQTASSNNVVWHKGYFVHHYPYGKIYSYPNKQRLEIN